MQVYAMVAPVFGASGNVGPWPLEVRIAEGLCLAVALGVAYRWARSPGMVVLNFELVDSQTGERPNLAQCIVRAVFCFASGLVAFVTGVFWLIAVAPHGFGITDTWFFWTPNIGFAVVLLAYLPVRFTKRRQSLWDLMTRTAVLKRAAPVKRAVSVVTAQDEPGV